MRNIVFIVYHVFMAFQHLVLKDYGAHYLDVIISYLEHLDLLLDTQGHLNTKNCGAHLLTIIFTFYRTVGQPYVNR